MAFTLSPHLDHLDFVDGDQSYCRKCNALVPFVAVRRDWVACSAGHGTHPGNLILNGLRR